MLPVYVMIGGESRRYGRDKATQPVDAEPWALHVGRRLADADSPVTLVGGDSNPISGESWIPDSEGTRGPLAGLRAALEDRLHRFGPGLLVFASCDLVRPQAAWLAPLIKAHEEDETLELAAYQTGDLWQPFPSVASTCWAESLAAGDPSQDGSLQRVIRRARCQAVAWPGATPGPPQANTPEELRAFLASSEAS